MMTNLSAIVVQGRTLSFVKRREEVVDEIGEEGEDRAVGALFSVDAREHV